MTVAEAERGRRDAGYLLGASLPMAIGWIGGTALGHALPLAPRGPLAVGRRVPAARFRRRAPAHPVVGRAEPAAVDRVGGGRDDGRRYGRPGLGHAGRRRDRHARQRPARRVPDSHILAAIVAVGLAASYAMRAGGFLAAGAPRQAACWSAAPAPGAGQPVSSQSPPPACSKAAGRVWSVCLGAAATIRLPRNVKWSCAFGSRMHVGGAGLQRRCASAHSRLISRPDQKRPIEQTGRVRRTSPVDFDFQT